MRQYRLLVRCLVWGSCALAQLPASAGAQASDPQDLGGVANEKARQTFKEGIEAFDRRDFEAARVAFLQTFALKPSAPVVRRNLGLAEIYSGHYLDGARRLARVLHMTAEGTAQDRARMLESLKKAEAHLERVTFEVNIEGAEIVVDGVDLGTSPLPFVWYVAPGGYAIRVEKPGHSSFAETRVARAGGAQHLRVSLAPTPVSEPLSQPPVAPLLEPALESGPKTWILVTGSALTVAAVASGVTFSLLAAASEDDVDDINQRLRGGLSCPAASECDDLMDATEAHDSQERWARASFVFAGITGLSTLLYGLLASAEPSGAQRAAFWSVDGDGRSAQLLFEGWF